jgi:flagella synthesis protein FlgN
MAAAQTDLLQTVTTEAGLVQQFVELLRHEQTVLTDGDTGALPEVVQDKDRLAEELGRLGSLRNASLTAQGFSPDRAGMENWCDKHPDKARARELWASLLASATEARELNRQNGELIRMRMQFTDKALEILQRRDKALELYGPDGLSSTHGNRRIDNAV